MSLWPTSIERCLEADQAGWRDELTILGNGFFVVRDPVRNVLYATQAGHFSLDGKGYLVTESGARLQGRTGRGLWTVGDIQIDAATLPSTSTPGAIMICHSIDSHGNVTVYLSDGTSFLRGQILLQNFQDPQALINEGRQLYSNLSEAGPLPALAAPGSNGLGHIQADVHEFSNTKVADYSNN